MDVQLTVRTALTKTFQHPRTGRFAALLVLLALLLPMSLFAASRDTPWRVTEIYIATMGYAPDAEGLDYWVSNIERRDEWTPTTVAQSFFDQPLVQQQYPSELGNDRLIDALYWNIFERAPDAEGFEYWRTQLAHGQVQRNQMIIALIEGGWANPDATEDMARFGNRVQVALAFADYQREHSIFYSALSADQQGVLREAGRTLLDGIGSVDGDVELGIARIPGLLVSIYNADAIGGVRLTLVGVDSIGSDTIQLAWLADLSTSTATGSIHYRLHAADTQGFVPDSSTEYTEVVDAYEGTITGLTPDHLYYVKVEAIDSQGRRSWSNSLSVVTAASNPVLSSNPRKVLDATNSADQAVMADQIDYRLPAGQSAPEPGDLLVSSEGDGYLRRAAAVEQDGDQVRVVTEPAALNELFDDFSFSTEIKLIDLPDVTSSQALAASGGVVSQRRTDSRRATWSKTGLTLIEERPTAPFPLAASTAAAISAEGGGCDNDSGRTVSQPDWPLTVTYPNRVCVEPGEPLEVQVIAEIASGQHDAWEFPTLELKRVTHPAIDKDTENFGMRFDAPVGRYDTVHTGTLRWLPSDHHFDDELRRYLVTIASTTKQTEGHCTGRYWWGGTYCETRTVEAPLEVVVTWGDLPEPSTEAFYGADADLEISGSAEITFQPTFRTEGKIALNRTGFAEAVISGPIRFNAEVTVKATGEANFDLDPPKRLWTKRFVKVLSVSPPVIVNGTFILDLDLNASANAELDLTQTLDLTYEIEAGIQYRDGEWTIVRQAQPAHRYEIRGEAEARAEVELRFIPDLEIAFYDVATARLILEPYLFAEAGLEGHFLYRELSDDSLEPEGTDADYRFTQLDVGGGVDGRFRAGLEVFDRSILGYPSNDRDEYVELCGDGQKPGCDYKAPLTRTVIAGLPTLALSRSNAVNREDCSAVGLTAVVEDIANPTKDFFDGPDSFNPFVAESADWQVVMPNGTEQLTQIPGTYDAWFSATTAGRYTLRFSGHSVLGSFVRQYEEITIDYDPLDDECPTTTYPLNDTGITACADEDTNGLTCPVANYPGQDAQFGRDVTHNDDSDGHAGFSFTKLDANGNALPASAASWSCVRDNVTGLVWEVKTTDGGLHDRDDSFTWYNTDASTNGGFEGYADYYGDICHGYDSTAPATYCNTQAYVARVNQQGLCGAHDWRLPLVDELLSIVSYDRYDPAIDTDYFPNDLPREFWSSSPSAGNWRIAWFLRFSNGMASSGGFKNANIAVRLVRAGQ